MGDLVRVRRQRWRVAGIQPFDGCRVLTLAGAAAANVGLTTRVIAPFDLVEPLEAPPPLRIVALRRWRRACRQLMAGTGPAGGLRTAADARIDLLPHQLAPALAVVRGLGSRVLIADEVGLGKTIEAGLVVAELRARGAADRVLVLAPAGLREQWASELARRFGIDAVVFDTHEGRRRAAELPVGLNPWSTAPAVICSIDYVKRPEVTAAVRRCRWDTVVIDEAHGITPGSDRHRAAAALCAAASYVVLLTATPHSGDHAAFSSLCDLGSRRNDRLLVFRRSRSEIGVGHGRRIHRLRIAPGAAERAMHAALEQLARAVRAERKDADRDAWLALTTLHKRAFSSAHSLERTVARRLEASGRSGDRAAHQPRLPLGDDDGEQSQEDDAPAWDAPLLDDETRERWMLERLATAARAARGSETKLTRLERLLARLERLGEPAIVFTEYRDTLLHVREVLSRDCALIHGGLGRDERRAAVDAFTGGRQSLLLATDAAGEGLNLHRSCRVVINLELPWNPNRLEQRIGRVDRIGQGRRVHVFHLIAAGTGEIGILDRLVHRIADAGSELGAADPIGMPFPAVGGRAVDRVPLVRLDAESRAEHVRLAAIRSLAWPQGAPQPAQGCLAAFSRRRAIRMQLASRMLVVMQTSIDDAFGRVVASHLTPLVVSASLSNRSAARGELTSMLPALDALSLERIDPRFAAWKEESSRFHAAFWSERLARERAIAAVGDGESPLVQAGLFDRRAELARRIADSLERKRRDEASRSIRAARAAARQHVRPSRAAIILVPSAG